MPSVLPSSRIPFTIAASETASAIYPAFRLLCSNQVILADDLARAMLDVAIRDTSEQRSSVFENRDIQAMSRRPK